MKNPTKAHITFTNSNGKTNHWLYSMDGEIFYECITEPTLASLPSLNLIPYYRTTKPLGFTRTYLESISSKIKFDPIE